MNEEKLNKIKEYLNDASDNVLDEYYNYNIFGSVSTVKDFERKFNIKGVSYDYKFPDDMNAEDFFYATRPFALFAELEANNYGFLCQRGIFKGSQQKLEEKKEEMQEYAKILYVKLLALNPEIKDFFKPVEEKTFEDLRSLILTTTSAYHPEDVKFFFNDKKVANKSKEVNNAIIEERSSGKHKNVFNSWSPSPKTMKLINQKLDQRGYPPATTAGQEIIMANKQRQKRIEEREMQNENEKHLNICLAQKFGRGGYLD